MEYYFILGSNPTLSLAEIEAKLGQKSNLTIHNQSVVSLSDEDINPQKLIKNLGGVIKVGEVVGFIKEARIDKLFTLIKPLLLPGAGKFKFGFSFYGCRPFRWNKLLAMDIKKHLKAQGISSRWVISRDKALSSVVVEQNKLVSQGVEIVFIKIVEGFLIGRTLAVQPFKELSSRDYGRPARDDRSGMLPPKLARIMINLSQADFNDIILDPFCGSGTVLTEAMIMGYKDLIGSDISPKAIENTKKNISWVKDKFRTPRSTLRIFLSDVKRLHQLIKKYTVGAIVTEPYLGPQRGKINIKKETKKLEELYSTALVTFNQIFKKSGRVVMAWPVFVSKTGGQPVFIYPKLNNFKIINPIQKDLRTDKNIKLTKRNTIIYGRPGQKIWREIVILKKNKK